MKKNLLIAGTVLALATGCEMKNPLLTESSAPFGAPEFDKIEMEHYLPAFEAGIAEAKAVMNRADLVVLVIGLNENLEGEDTKKSRKRTERRIHIARIQHIQ